VECNATAADRKMVRTEDKLMFGAKGNLATKTSPTILFTGTQMNGYGKYTGYTLGNNRILQNTLICSDHEGTDI
jgi:hypothetical protein